MNFALTLKLANPIGLAVGSPLDSVLSRTIKPPKGGDVAAALMEHMRRLYEACQFEAIFVEEFALAHSDNPSAKTSLINRLRAAVGEFAAARGIPVIELNRRQVRKAWTGDGTAGRDTVMSYALARQFQPESHEQAEALAMFHFVSTEVDEPSISALVPPKFEPDKHGAYLFIKQMKIMHRIRNKQAPKGESVPYSERKRLWLKK